MFHGEFINMNMNE
jgi:hypothetical protein